MDIHTQSPADVSRRCFSRSSTLDTEKQSAISPRPGITLHKVIPEHVFTERIWGDAALTPEKFQDHLSSSALHIHYFG